METEKELNVKITKLTSEIREKHPEMSKMLEEMPVTIPNENNPEVNIRKLKEYYESLIALVKQYTDKID